ncbi:MAG: DUF4350 domain-containing protein [Bacteroidetes bacterium]|nr:DUF4350 domain-containing protein [Bacteroidota bacterium]
MLKGNKKYIFFLSLCFVILITLQIIAPKPINWNPTYLKKDKNPFGTAALFELLPSLFSNTSETKGTIYTTLNNSNKKGCSYIIINEGFSPDELDTRELLNFVKNGNNAFIAANYFSGKFADTLELKTDNYYDIDWDLSDDTANIKSLYKQYDTAKINFITPSLKSQTSYTFIKGVENTYFTSFDTTKAIALGNNQYDKLNFIKIPFGKGNIFISTLPEVFCNYHVAHKTNHEYAIKALSYLPNGELIWDEYYKVGNVKQDNFLRVIFDNKALSSAYYLALISLILFMIIGIKRKQRIIPVMEPFENTTLKFVETVGTLYYQTGDHKNIAGKKITFFLEHIRNTFHVKTNIYDTTFIDRISNLSGIDKEKVHALFYYFSDIEIKTQISQQELIKLNGMIEEFHKLSNRK